MTGEHTYQLLPGVQVLRDGDARRIRKGVWEYVEVSVDLSDEPDHVRQRADALFARLRDGEAVDPGAIAAESDDPGAASRVLRTICDRLERSGLATSGEDAAPLATTLALLGDAPDGFDGDHREGRVLAFSDSAYAMDGIERMAEPLAVAVEPMDRAAFERVRQANLTDTSNATRTAKEREALADDLELDRYDCVVGCLGTPNVTFLRNLNRLVVHRELPASVGFVDGPFLSALTVDPPETGCLECFENRVLAAMNDHRNYQSFVERQREAATDQPTPLLHWLAAVVVSEGYLLAAHDRSKFVGRSLNVYLPTFEVHAEDVLALPFCHCRGDGRLRETHAARNELVDGLLERAAERRDGR